jgi:hypothetical protein
MANDWLESRNKQIDWEYKMQYDVNICNTKLGPRTTILNITLMI